MHFASVPPTLIPTGRSDVEFWHLSGCCCLKSSHNRCRDEGGSKSKHDFLPNALIVQGPVCPFSTDPLARRVRPQYYVRLRPKHIAPQKAMSAFAPIATAKADSAKGHVCFTLKPDICSAPTMLSLRAKSRLACTASKRDRYSITSSAPRAGNLAIFVEISRNAASSMPGRMRRDTARPCSRGLPTSHALR